MFARFNVQVRYCVTYIIMSSTRDKIYSATHLLSLYYKIFTLGTGVGIAGRKYIRLYGGCMRYTYIIYTNLCQTLRLLLKCIIFTHY